MSKIVNITDSKEMSWRWSKKKIKAEIKDIIISGNYSDQNISFYKKRNIINFKVANPYIKFTNFKI